MYVVSKQSVTYIADRWRHALTGLILLALAMLIAAPIMMGIYYDGFAAIIKLLLDCFDPTKSSLIDDLTIVVWLLLWLGFVGSAVHFGFRKVFNPDKITISTKDLSISRYGFEQRYRWSDVGKIRNFTGRGGSTIFIDLIGTSKTIRFSPFLFGRQASEIVGVINGAKVGAIISPTEWNLQNTIK